MNCEACLSEDPPCGPQRVLQQRKKNVVEAGEESRVRRGVSRPTVYRYAPAYNKKNKSTGRMPATVTVTVTEAVGIVHVMEFL